MDERQLVPAGGLGFDNLGGAQDARLNQPVVDQAVFQGWEHVRPDVDLVARGVDDSHTETLEVRS